MPREFTLKEKQTVYLEILLKLHSIYNYNVIKIKSEI